MLECPQFERTVIVSDDALLAARLSSLFTRKGRYLPILEGPRMGRADASNEIIRRRNAIASAGAERVLLAGLGGDAQSAMSGGWKASIASSDFEELVSFLRGVVRRPSVGFPWGATNLAVGLYQARLARRELVLGPEESPEVASVAVGTHLLVVVEDVNLLSQVIASNIAFACKASLVVFPGLADEESDDWLEALYALGQVSDVSKRLAELCERARAHLPRLEFARYKRILFVTRGFPWGIAVPECISTHMYSYPDFGRAMVEGLWAAQSPRRTARTGLLVDPQQVEGSEIAAIRRSLLKNRTLTCIAKGPAANVHRVQSLFDLLPFDIIVISTHCGDVAGQRITYEYDDADGRRRRLIVDQAMGVGHNPSDDTFLVQQYIRFRSLDGVDWTDTAGKKALPVGSAITSWFSLERQRTDHIVQSEPISRVAGSMALKMSDGVWIVMTQGFAPGCAPVILNNACSSWHELGERVTFAGARAYIGTLFPITDAEAQEVGQLLFGANMGRELPAALWLSQRAVYGDQGRRPYAMVGVPFTAMLPNTVRSVEFMIKAYRDGIASWEHKAATSPFEDVQANSNAYVQFLREDLEHFLGTLRPQK